MKIKKLVALLGVLFLSAANAADTGPIKLGFITDMSGLYADVDGKGGIEAMNMAIADFGGSVLGRKIEVVALDHQNKADIAAAKAREWIDQDGVNVIFGGMDPHERKDESKESKEEKEPQEENKDEMDDRKHADSDSDDDMGSERVQYSDSDSDSDMDSQRAQRGRGMSGGMEIDLPYSSSKGYHRYGFGMSGGNFDGPAVINHMQRMLRDLQQVVVVPNHILARLFNITVNWEQGNVTQAELVDFYRAFTSMYRDFFPAVGGSIFDTPIIQQGDPRRIFPSPKLDIRDTMKPLRF